MQKNYHKATEKMAKYKNQIITSAFIERGEDTVPSYARKNLTIGNSNEKTSEPYLTTIKEFNPELVIIDNYDVDCAWEREIKKTASEAKILVIDDSSIERALRRSYN